MTRFALAMALLLLGCSRDSENMQVAGPAAEPRNDAAQQPAGETELPPENGAEAAPAAAGASPCLVQDGKPVPANRIRAIGTEPFWAAQVEGRCVTYSTPDDQDGTRVWTKFSGSAESDTWTGALNGKPFVMTTRPQADCSDGMSDSIYPIAVSLTVGGEQRSGCAEPK